LPWDPGKGAGGFHGNYAVDSETGTQWIPKVVHCEWKKTQITLIFPE